MSLRRRMRCQPAVERPSLNLLRTPRGFRVPGIADFHIATPNRDE
jgi:hypothetical protein